MVATLVNETQDVFSKNIVWDMEDKYGHARALRIKTPDGDDTTFSMVYGKNEEGVWNPVRPVSDRFEPIGTEDIINKVVQRLGGKKEIHSERIRLGRGGVSHQVELVLNNNAIMIGDTTENENADLLSNGIIEPGNDIWRPTIRVRNALDGTRAISVIAGWFRLVCSNGLVSNAWEGSSSHTIKIHTVHQVQNALDEIADFDFNVKEFEKMLEKMRKKVISKAELTKIKKLLPKNYKAGFDEIADKSAYGVLNFMTYLQSHQFSMNRESKVQPIVDSMFRRIA